MQKKTQTNYTFKPLNFNNDMFFNENNFGFDNQSSFGGSCPRCNNPCNFPPRPEPPCNRPPQPPPFCPPNTIRPPLSNFPCCPPLPPQDCTKDNFRYFLIGYLFGSWN